MEILKYIEWTKNCQFIEYLLETYWIYYKARNIHLFFLINGKSWLLILIVIN